MAWLFAGNAGQQVAGFLIFLVLAWTLSPVEFGIMALAAALVDLLTVLGRFGQVEALLQRPADERADSTSFWILVASGVGFLGLVLAVAPLLSDLYANPLIGSALVLLSPVPLITNLSQVPEASLRRQLRHKSLALRNMAATTVSGLVAIGLAQAGLGVWALVAQKLTQAVVHTVVVLIAEPARPRLTFDRKIAATLVRVGGNISLATTVNALNPRIVDVLVGYFLGLAQLGQLRVAWRLYDFLLQIVIQPVSQVAVTTLARSVADPDALRAAALRYLLVLTAVAAPVFVGAGLAAGPLVALTLGPVWGSAGLLLALLSATGPTVALNFLFGPIMLHADRAGLLSKAAVLQVGLNMLLVLAALPFGTIWVVGAIVLRVYLMFAYNLARIMQVLSVKPGTVWSALGPPVVAAAAMVPACLVAEHAIGTLPPVFHLAWLAPTGALVFVAVLAAGSTLGPWRGYLGTLARVASRFAWRAPST